jgi:hypothetical protein
MGFFGKALEFVKRVGSKAIDAGRWIGTKGADFVTRLAPLLPGPFGAAAMTGAAAMRGVGAIANGIHGLGQHVSGVRDNVASAASSLAGVRQAYGGTPGVVTSKIER